MHVHNDDTKQIYKFKEYVLLI